MSIYLYPNIIYVSDEGSGESAHMHKHSSLADAISSEISCADPCLIAGSDNTW